MLPVKTDWESSAPLKVCLNKTRNKAEELKEGINKLRDKNGDLNVWNEKLSINVGGTVLTYDVLSAIVNFRCL